MAAAAPTHDLKTSCRDDKLPCKHMVVAHPPNCEEKECTLCGMRLFYSWEGKAPHDYLSYPSHDLDFENEKRGQPANTPLGGWWEIDIYVVENIQQRAELDALYAFLRRMGNRKVTRGWIKWMESSSTIRFVKGAPRIYIGNGALPRSMEEMFRRMIRYDKPSTG